ncbi:MAG: rod shape-determining protein MreC [Candidatus Dadabacteria bacterium]|nr:rod shape-determining protein MreC [Candidatus Dadabacteria bacterium]MYA49041.1 rod shape-determining protein MreC [Candidatus Dadabacteria bacterium]MYF47606.1 rod shape-determining protein MreC [Candidatus Dadabacteria bacterium]MYG83181.1 rod shape-determining protein MreC [Candidatus Dadabacteria bacterium]MYK49486.1 rod shape-determining protein MreC [Candidatus Dadabacteria bacterium]
MRKFFTKNQLFLSFILIIASIHLLPVVFDLTKRESSYTTKLMLSVNHSSGAFSNYIKDGVRYYWDHYIDLVDTSVENSRLKAQLQEMETQNLMLTEIRLENERLRSLLNYKNSYKGKMLGARVIGGSPSVVGPGFLIIDKGSSSGIKKGAPVLTNVRAIGTIHSVNEKTSMVMLMTNPSSVADAIVQRSRARGIVTGAGNHYVMKYLEQEDDVIAGDKVISSGKDSVFPKNIVIGTVTKVESDRGLQRAIIKPEIDVSRVEEVLIHLN